MKTNGKTRADRRKRYLVGFLRFWKDFRVGVILLVLLLGASALSACGWWTAGTNVSRVVLALFVVFLVAKPMNVVYGLIGTRGDVRIFMVLLILINLLFSSIYYLGFFRNAGVTYDTNQPYISYGMFKGAPAPTGHASFTDTVRVKGMDESAPLRSEIVSRRAVEGGRTVTDTLVLILPTPAVHPFTEESRHYQRMDWWTVTQNTFLTSLMQEPTDLFSNCAVFNDIQCAREQNLSGCNDRSMSRLFSWVLVLQVFISWIFFGVFISILYNRFRFEV